MLAVVVVVDFWTQTLGADVRTIHRLWRSVPIQQVQVHRVSAVHMQQQMEPEVRKQPAAPPASQLPAE